MKCEAAKKGFIILFLFFTIYKTDKKFVYIFLGETSNTMICIGINFESNWLQSNLITSTKIF